MILGILCSGFLGFKSLKYLYEKYHIKMVFTDKKSYDIINFCLEKKIDCYIGNPRGNRTKDFISNIKVDILISINYLFIIEEDIINVASGLAFNIHGSLLPKYRGRTPHVWAIINNEKETGITAHVIDKGCDTGMILEQVRIPIEKNDTGYDILSKFEINYIPLIDRVLNKYKKNKLTFIKQDISKATFFGKREPKDGLINWDWQKDRIFNWVRAQSHPYPGAFTFYKNEKLIIDEIAFSDIGFDYQNDNGLILNVINNQPYVKVSNGVIIIKSLRNNTIIFNKGEVIRNEK